MANEMVSDAAYNPGFVSGFEELRLNALIHDRTSEIHRIDEDIDRLEQGLVDIDHSIDCFEQAVSDMQLLEAEVDLIFKGESAAAFSRKIAAYRLYCTKRIAQMRSLKSNYTNQINGLRRQKAMAEMILNRLRENLAKIRNQRDFRVT